MEKYRPVFLDDIVGNTETIERLKIIAKDGNMPHVIISGMPGIGKTTSVLCLARQLLGDAYKEAVLELNASDERGIDVVRNRIKGFAQKKVTLPGGRQKIVILDEADSMTSGAQQALRRTMEIYSGTTRFAFACNQSNKIIEPSSPAVPSSAILASQTAKSSSASTRSARPRTWSTAMTV